MSSSILTIPSNLNSDRFAIRNAVTSIRNSYMHVDGRQLLIIAGSERRASVRVGVKVPVRITAADVDHGDVTPQSRAGTVIAGICHDISLGGFGLAHSSPLAAEFAIVRFDIPADEPIDVAVELVWSNRSDDGSWLSGARIIGLTQAK